MAPTHLAVWTRPVYSLQHRLCSRNINERTGTRRGAERGGGCELTAVAAASFATDALAAKDKLALAPAPAAAGGTASADNACGAARAVARNATASTLGAPWSRYW